VIFDLREAVDKIIHSGLVKVIDLDKRSKEKTSFSKVKRLGQ
jgi:hypothetical protein